LVVFGGDGSDGYYGLWLPEQSERQESAPVIELGEIFDDPAFMAVAGTGVVPFLAARTVYYLRLYEDLAEAATGLDILGAPEELRIRDEVDDELFAAIYRWADPELGGLILNYRNRWILMRQA
jgi:hypothetical protein